MTTPVYQRPLPRSWWLRRRAYLAFMLRELTSLVVGGYAAFLMVLLARANDPDSFARLVASLQSGPSVVLHVIALVAMLYHAVTWINLTPRVLVLWRDDEQVPPRLIAGANYLAWVVVTALVAWVVLR